MKQRDQVAMTPTEVNDMLAAGRKVQLATNGTDGYPHLVTMYYTMLDGQIAFWTYRRSQKARNLERDPRISCLVETGDQYFDLRGVLVHGIATRIDDPAAVAEIGRRITMQLADPVASGSPTARADQGAVAGNAGSADSQPDTLAEYVTRAARKRVGYRVELRRIISWDHGKLLTGRS